MEITKNSNKNLSKYKEMLISLFKKSFDYKLNFLEKRTHDHLSLISSTKEITNDITIWTSKIQAKIASKYKKEKEDSLKKYKKKKLILKKKINSPKSTLSKGQSFKTPVRSIKNYMKSNDSKSTLNSKKKNLSTKNHYTTPSKRAFKAIDKKSKTIVINKKNKNTTDDKINLNKTDTSTKLNKTYSSNFHNNNNKNSLKYRPSLGSLRSKDKKKTNKKNIIALYNYDNNRDNISNRNYGMSKKKEIKTEPNSISKDKKLVNKTFEKRKSKLVKKDSFTSSYFTNKNKKENKNESLHKNRTLKSLKEFNNKKKEKETINLEEQTNNNTQKNKIKSMESNLQKDEPLFHHDDPLLIAPVTDIDFQKNELVNSSIASRDKNILEYFKNNKEKNIKTIFEFLSIKDLIQLKGVSKFFNKNILDYFLKGLNESKKKVKIIKSGITNIPKTKNFKDFVFSKGTEKSIELLNQKIINKFFEELDPPKKDILFIYQIFFQLINNNIKDLFNDKKQFWEKCRMYFLNEGKGKIGNLLKDIIAKNEIDISEDNLYKIYELVKNKLYIILPSYFNRVCNTTVLMTFYIKDILNFLGISNDDEDVKQNGYWTYSYIMNSIDKKINKIISYK